MEPGRPCHRPSQDQGGSLTWIGLRSAEGREPTRDQQLLLMGGEQLRLQRFMAEAGLASRRAAEALILAGRVRVNGQVVRELGRKVHRDKDEIIVDGSRLRVRSKVHVALHKPRGYLCTRRDPQGRRTIFDLLPEQWGHLYSVGRLDRESEGLVFLTNDGEFALRLAHPRYGCRKTYRVIVAGRVDAAVLARLECGVIDRGERLRAAQARLVSAGPAKSVVEVTLSEGKNREIRRMFEWHGLEVTRLQRTRIGCVGLGHLPAGQWRALTEPEIESLLHSL